MLKTSGKNFGLGSNSALTILGLTTESAIFRKFVVENNFCKSCLIKLTTISNISLYSFSL